MIDGICIYFEVLKLDLAQAKVNCISKFGNGNNGRLFEPKSLHTHELVFNASLPIIGSGFKLIGVDDLSIEGNYVYSSNSDQIAFPIPWYPGSPGSQGMNVQGMEIINNKHVMRRGYVFGSQGQDCIWTGWQWNDPRWTDAYCQIPVNSICEMVRMK